MNMKEKVFSLKEGDMVFSVEMNCLNSRVPDVFVNLEVVKVGRKFIDLKTNEGEKVKCELTIGRNFNFASGSFGIYQIRHVYFSREDYENELKWKKFIDPDNLNALSVDDKQEMLKLFLK